jgi:hypothetical protein
MQSGVNLNEVVVDSLEKTEVKLFYEDFLVSWRGFWAACHRDKSFSGAGELQGSL